MNHWILVHAPAVAMPVFAMSYLLLIMGGGASAPAGPVSFSSAFSSAFH